MTVAFRSEHGTPRLTQRTPEDVARFLGGLELLEPGVVSCARRRPGGGRGAGARRTRSRCPAGWRASPEVIISGLNAAGPSHVWR
ncbi:hypothetical protein J2X68_002520 [Streptomyces sp. 3330]|nr:hypothetical protein [Streptomyces sp. 3330]